MGGFTRGPEGERNGGRELTGRRLGRRQRRRGGGSCSQSQRGPRFLGAGPILASLWPTLVVGQPLPKWSLGCKASNGDPWPSMFPVDGIWILIFMASIDVTRRSPRKACRWLQPLEKAGPPVQTEQPPQSFSARSILSVKRNWDLPCCPWSLSLALEESQISGPQSTNTLLVHPHGHPACVCIPRMPGNSHLRYFLIVFEELCYSKRASSPGMTSILCSRPQSSIAASPLGQLSTPLVWSK